MSTTSTIFTWILAMMNSVSPANKQTQETEIQATERYESIAQNIIDVAFDKNQKPLFDGDNARIKTAAVMVAIDYFESKFRKDVDTGLLRGDHGNSWCLAQINLGGGKIKINENGSFNYLSWDSKEGWSGEDLINDRKKCFKVQLSILRTSFECNVSNNWKLNRYASGFCDRGGDASFVRMTLAKKFWEQTELNDSISFTFLENA